MDKDQYYMLYTLYFLSYKGVSVEETICMNLKFLKDWYIMSGNTQYIELALLQLKVAVSLGVSFKKYMELCKDICFLAKTDMDDIVKQRIVQTKTVPLTRPQIKNIIRKWMPSRDNPMTISEVIDDIISKVENNEIGHYFYTYGKAKKNTEYSRIREDNYELVITETESYFVDLKNFQFYIFIKKGKDEQC